MKKIDCMDALRMLVGDDNVRENVKMSKYTSFRTGGDAKVLLTPRSHDALCAVLKYLKEKQQDYLLLGNCSNVLISDDGIDCIVVLTGGVREIKVTDTVIQASCGALLSEVSNVAAAHGLAGLEFASGIPGSLGGAVFMNAGAYGGEMMHVVSSVTYMDEKGALQQIEGEACAFAYRSSIFKNHPAWTILDVTLKLCAGEEEQIRARMQELNSKRKEKQPLQYPSAGSTFKRPQGYFAGKLIEDCGLKGCRIGGAMVSEKHAGFIVNVDNATSKDIENLILFVKQTVWEKYGVLLEPEVLRLPVMWKGNEEKSGDCVVLGN